MIIVQRNIFLNLKMIPGLIENYRQLDGLKRLSFTTLLCWKYSISNPNYLCVIE